MDTLETYRTYIKKVITDYANFAPLEEIERQLIFDTEHDHYQLVNVGWRNDRRVHGCVIHIDLKDGKIWLQHNGTELGLAHEFVALGVPKQDIVIGFHSPFKRQFTEFAVG